MNLSEAVKEYRLEHRYSLREFADLCGLSHVQIRRIETGVKTDGRPFEPKIKTEDRLAATEPQPDLPEIRTNFREMYEKLTPEKKNVFWKAFVGSIEVSRERVITLTFHTTKVLAERMAKYDAGLLSQEQ